MSCILRAEGEHFDVNLFLSETSLTIDSFWCKGEKRFPLSTRNHAINTNSGIRIVTSDAEFSELLQQVDDTILFLQMHFNNIEKLVNYDGIEGITLDFGIEIKPPGWQSFYFPPELLSLVSKLNITLSISTYPSSGADD